MNWDLQVTILVHCIYNVATPLSTLSIGPGKTVSHMHDINDHQRKYKLLTNVKIQVSNSLIFLQPEWGAFPHVSTEGNGLFDISPK